jgi:thiamine pyrophosphate-dependent acetolactate synthase large subunit-like protein
MVETMVAWGVTHVFGMVGHSNLGFANALRSPPRSRTTARRSSKS